MNIKKLFSIALFFILVCTGCTGAASTPTATPTKDLGPERTATAEAEQDAAEHASQTADAIATENILASQTAQALLTMDAQSTADAKATATIVQKELYQEATRTQGAVDRLTATAAQLAQVTAQAQPLYDLAQLLFQNGILTDVAGSFIPVADFEQEWAQMNYYNYWPITESFLVDTGNFILRTDITWMSASENANWNIGGCGFVVYDLESGKHHLIHLSMDGYANLSYNDGRGTAYMKAKRQTNAQGVPGGEAEFVLAVQNQTITVYVNGEEAYSFTDTKYLPGILAYTLISGTNKDFGTRCEWSNSGFWVLEK